MRNNFKVTPATLVPRPETELLVESLVKAAPMLRADGAVKALDIGTGSGAIIVSLLDYLLLPLAWAWISAMMLWQ